MLVNDELNPAGYPALRRMLPPTPAAPKVVSANSGFSLANSGGGDWGSRSTRAPAAVRNAPDYNKARYGVLGGLVKNMKDALLSGMTKGKLTDARVFNKNVADAMARSKARAGGGSGGGGSGSSSSSLEASMAALGLKAAGDPYDRALGQLGVDYGNNRNQATLQGRRQDKDLAELFGRLGNYTGNLKNAQSGEYDKSGKAIGKNYDQLLSTIGQSYKQGAGNTTAELQRLGIGEVSPSAMAGLGRDASEMLNQARVDKTNAGTNNTANKNTFNSLMQEMIGSAAIEGTTQRGRAKQATSDALNALMQQYAKDKTELSGKKADALLQARMANLQRAQAAAMARASASRRSGGGSGGGTASAKAPKGFDAAYAWINQYAGGNSKKAQDLRSQLNYLSQSPRISGNPNNTEHMKFGYSDPQTMDHLYNVWAGKEGTGTKAGYNRQDAEAIQRAIAIVFGKA